MSAAEEIARYFDLLKAGAITESEFATAKASLLGASQPGTSAVKNQAVGKAKENPKAVKKVQGNPNPLHTGVAVAAGVVGGRLIADQLLDDPSVDPAAFATETITFPDGDTFAGAAVEMPNGDVFYSITESTGSEIYTMTGTLTADQVQDFNNDYSEGIGSEHYHNVDTSIHDSGSDSEAFEDFDFF